MENTAVIRKLTVARFRGIEKLEWRPLPGMNIILGGGDVGKTTILEAIALLLSPTNSTTVGREVACRRFPLSADFVAKLRLDE